MHEILKAPTIASCTKSNGAINRAKADRILDPKGYFKKKKKISENEQLLESFNLSLTAQNYGDKLKEKML
jgi:hypothetical protein